MKVKAFFARLMEFLSSQLFDFSEAVLGEDHSAVRYANAACPGDLRDCPEMCHECEGLVDYELETYRALSPIEARAKEAAEVLQGVPL
jgi:hypothetical protein